MKQILVKFFSFFLLITSFNAKAQVINSRVLDSITQKPVPYVTIQLNKSGVITNEEGRFSFNLKSEAKKTDSLIVSCIGFETLTKPLYQFKDSIIYLVPKTIELKEVVLTNKHYTAEEIIEKAKENIDKNYNFNLTKKRLFFRESNYQDFIKSDYVLKKSTIDALNKPFLDSVIQSIPKKNSYYTEILCDLYGDFSNENQKIRLIKASELYDKNNEIGAAALEEKFKKIIEKNVKPDSYFKIKSGILSQKLDGIDNLNNEDIDSTNTEALKKKLEEKKKNEANRKVNFAGNRKSSLSEMLKKLFFQEKTPLNFIRKSNRYRFKMLDLTYLKGKVVYVLNFFPRGSADYKGTLYINYDDFAIIRVDYENIKPIKSFKLFGFSYKQFVSKGKIIFSKGNDNLYNLQYLESEDAERVGIRRPLKIIEKNKYVKGRRKQNELYVKIDMAIISSNKNEVIFFDTEDITTTNFKNITEKRSILPIYMPTYNPAFWKGYNIIEPNEAIKKFTIIEE